MNNTFPGVMEVYLEEFEAAHAAGLAPRIEEYLTPQEHADYLTLLVELACIDLERRWEQGARPGLEIYFQRFPRLANYPAGRTQLAFEDYRQRLLAGLAPRPDDYRQRFGIEVADWPQEALSADKRRRSFPQSPSDRPLENVGLTRRVQADAIPDPGTLSHHASLANRLREARAQLPEVGTEFLGFQLLHELGRGAFGVVFLARQGDLANRLVALKCSPDLNAESDRLAQLQHTNIVPVYSIHRSGNMHAICMPYFGCATVADLCAPLARDMALPASGGYIISTLQNRQSTLHSVRDQIASSRGLLPVLSAPPAPAGMPLESRVVETLDGFESMSYVNAVLWIATRLADGLAHAHARGIVHRDLKPANILLTDDGQPMLLDFNLADDLKQRTSVLSAHVGGTLPYMSPEQLEAFATGRTPIDGRSDVYSLGLILYQMLTGRPPFPLPKGPTHELLSRMLEDRRKPPPRLRPFNNAISPAVESIILHCLEADVGRRYPSARHLKQDLDRHLADRPLRYAPEPSWVERTRKWARRHPRLASPLALAMTGAVALLVVASVTVALSLEGRKRQLDVRREAALDQYSAFQRGFREAELLLSNDDAEQVRQGVQAGLEVLAPYRVLDNEDWPQRSPAVDLPPGDRERLRHEVGELAFLLARATLFQEGPDAKDSAQGRLLHSLASACLGSDAEALLTVQQADLASTEKAAEAYRGLRETLHGTATEANQLSFLLACEHTAHGHYREALKILTRVVDAGSTQYGAWYLKGRCHEALGQTDEALFCYGSCIALRPDFAQPYMARAAVIYNHHRDLQQARADLDLVLQKDPRRLTARIDRSLVLAKLGEERKALADLNDILADPRAPTRVFFLRASVHERLGDQASAKSDFDQGMKRQPTDVVSWISRGVARVPTDPDGALDDFRQAERLNPRSIDALMNQAYILGEVKKKHAEALEVLDRLVQINPDYVVGRASRGVLLARLGRTTEAVAEAKTCLAGRPAPETSYRAACIYALAAKGDQAMLRESRRLLASALLQGWGFEYLVDDDDLASLRKQTGFATLLEVVRLLQNWQK